MPNGTTVTFILYFVILLVIGAYCYRRSTSIEDYLLGGRGMGAWVTALSAQASDMSGWLLMGLPGAVYLAGGREVWIAVGLFIGTALNWLIVASRLRVYTERVGAITLPCFFEARFADPTGLVRTLSALVILIFFTIYATSGLVAAGRLFESVFNLSYSGAVLVGGVIIVFYTFLGGFLAVCWTDLFQGSLMVLAIVVVPIWGMVRLGGPGAVGQHLAEQGVSMNVLPQGFGPVAMLSAMAWGLGYFGQPHILTRFMSARSLSKLRESMAIAIVWVALSLAGAVAIGFVGAGLVAGLKDGEEEKVFIYMIQDLLDPWLGGVMLAAVLSAIMSTIDSQLLVSSSALSEDFYQKVLRRQAAPKEVVRVGRLCVLVIAGIALVLALAVDPKKNPDETILRIVAYAWGGFGAAFGPVMLFALFSRRTTWYSALAGMVAGTVTFVVWKQAGLGGWLYEIVPGFLAGVLAIAVIDRIAPQRDADILRLHEEVVAVVGGRGRKPPGIPPATK